MLNLSNRKSLFSFALVPFMINSSEIGSREVIYNTTDSETGQIIAQNTLTGWIASFWRRRPSKPLAARSTSGICPIAPGLVETYIVWHDRPLFLWRSPGKNENVQLIVREYDSQEVVSLQQVNLAEQKVFYSGKEPLEFGKLYQWQLSDSTNWITFQVMQESERNKIQADLQILEQKLGLSRAAQEEIALRKADYFLNYQIKHKTEDNVVHPWSDALQTLYKVDQPSPSFAEKREAYVANLCIEFSPVTQVK